MSEPGTAVRPVSDSDAALARYGRRMRRSRGIYYAALTVLAAVLVAAFAVAYERGEIAHAHLHTVAAAPADLPISTPSASQRVAWRSTDRAAIGSPRWNGTVIVYGGHTVHGIDARTGRTTWSYTRTDRTVCATLQTSGYAIAIYRLAGNCDEITTLDAGTGERLWSRTLDENGQPLNGRPTYQVLSYTVMITTPTVIYAIDPSTGFDRWTYSHFGCTIQHAVLGTSGALISQNCTRPRCGQLKFCGSGPQLLLRDGLKGQDTDNQTNPNKIDWNDLGSRDVPVSADTLISAFAPSTRALDTFLAGTGAIRTTVPLTPRPLSFDTVSAISLDGPELIALGGRTYAVTPGATRQTWSVATSGPPTVSIPGNQAPTPTSRVVTAIGSDAALLDGSDGSVAQRYPLSPAPPGGASVYSLGSGFLVAAASGTTAYR